MIGSQNHEAVAFPEVGCGGIDLSVIVGGTVLGGRDGDGCIPVVASIAQACTIDAAVLTVGAGIVFAECRHQLIEQALAAGAGAAGREVANAVRRAKSRHRRAVQHMQAHAHAQAKGVVVEHVPEGGHIVAAQAYLAPLLALQIDQGLAVEAQTIAAACPRRLVVGVGGLAGAVVGIETRFQIKAGGQTAAEIFTALEAQAAGLIAAGGQHLTRACASAAVIGYGHIHHAIDLHRGLCRGRQRRQRACESAQRIESHFFCSHSCLLEPLKKDA